MKSAERWQAEMVVGNTVTLAQIRAIQQDAFLAGEVEGMQKASVMASQFSIQNKPIHPIIAADKMSEPARLVYHTTCQHVSEEIQSAITQLRL